VSAANRANPGSDAQPSPGQCNLGCNLHLDSAACTRTGQLSVSSKRRLRAVPVSCWSSQSMSGRSQSRSSSFTLQFRWRTGCRVRRHWDQPDHHPDGLQPQPPAPRADQYGQRVRPRVIDLLVDDDHRHPDAGDARRQRRRRQIMALITLLRRYGGAAGSSHRHDAGRAGPLRRHSVLRREHDHPRDLARVRSEQPEPRCRRHSPTSGRC